MVVGADVHVHSNVEELQSLHDFRGSSWDRQVVVGVGGRAGLGMDLFGGVACCEARGEDWGWWRG